MDCNSFARDGGPTIANHARASCGVGERSELVPAMGSEREQESAEQGENGRQGQEKGRQVIFVRRGRKAKHWAVEVKGRHSTR